DVQEGKHFKETERIMADLVGMETLPDLKMLVAAMRMLRDTCTEDVCNDFLDGVRADRAAAEKAAKQAAAPSANGEKTKRPAAGAAPPTQAPAGSWHVDMPIVT